MTDSVDFAEESESVSDLMGSTVSEPVGELEIAGEGWSGADIEEAYLKALHAMEDFPEDTASAAGASAEGNEPSQSVPVATAGLPVAEVVPASDIALASAVAPAADAFASEITVSDTAQADPAAHTLPTAPAVENPHSENLPAGVRLAKGTERPPQAALNEYSKVSPVQVIEAALFVGGTPLTARKICGLLRGSSDTAFVEQSIDELNAAYQAQGRPYEIRLGEGGYRLELCPEFDRLRHRVYGSGPREVRLAQDVLEVLALVAYRQPISQKEIESQGKDNAGNLLRQLLRRDLISFERGPGGRKDLQYQTTPRFLSVFGLAGLADLPQAEDLAKK